jgi:hypothetical protein
MPETSHWILYGYRHAARLTAEARELHRRGGNTDQALNAYRTAAAATAAALHLHRTGNR